MPIDDRNKLTDPVENDLKVWYVPQVPMPAYEVAVNDLEDAARILGIIINFSIFEFDNRVKGDYSDATGVSRWEPDGEGGFDWFDVDSFEFEELGIEAP